MGRTPESEKAMMTNDQVRAHMGDRERIKRAVKMLCDAFARKLTEEALDTWAERLLPYADKPLLWRVLKDAVAWENWPNLGQLLGKIQSEIKHNEAAKPIPPMTERERKRADESAVRAILWLHYEKGWQPRDFAGSIFARQLGTDADAALRIMKQQHDRVSIALWMADQERIGN
jgi:hypothetical protein